MPSTDLPISGKHGFLALRSRQVGSTPMQLRVELDGVSFSLGKMMFRELQSSGV